MERRMRLSHNLEASPTEYSLIVQGRASGEHSQPHHRRAFPRLTSTAGCSAKRQHHVGDILSKDA